MAKYATLKAAVEAAIKTNGQQQITGQVLQTQLVNMITSLGKYFQSFGGLATPAGSFSAGDESVTFLAVEAGTYTNFGGAVLDGKTLHVLAYDGDWADVDTSIPSGAAFEAALALAIKGSQSGIAEGIADTISAGTAQEFLQRQSGGDGVNCLKRIKGKTIAWNQLVKNGDFANGATGWSGNPIIANGVATQTKTTTGTATYVNIAQSGLPYINAHKYLFKCEAKCNNSGTQFRIIPTGTASDGSTAPAYYQNWETVSLIWSRAGTSATLSLRGANTDSPSSDISFSVRNVICIDLTLLGLGDLTAAQFEALYPALYYAPASVLKSNDAAALLTDGFNQWDEEWEVGGYDPNTGLPAYGEQIRSKTTIPIPVFPNTEYCFTCLGARVSQIYWYGADGNFIVRTQNSSASAFTATSPANACFCKFQCPSSYGTTYNNDICINLSDASFNGTYEPYWKRVLALRITELTGIPEGGTEADRVTIFPNGLRGLGASYDEIAGGKATKRRGVRAYESGDESDASVITDGTNTDYALATPIVYTDLQYADGTPFTMPATILVDNYGTERIQAPEGATTPSAPFCCDSNYSIGVANLVKRLAALENAE